MRICKDYCVIESQNKIIEAQRQENEQLRARVARMRETLNLAESRLLTIEQATEYIKPGAGVWHTIGIALQEIQRFKQSLSTTPTEQAGLCCSCGTRNATISTDDGQYCKACAEDLEQEEAIDLLTYHNPADVEEIERLKSNVVDFKEIAVKRGESLDKRNEENKQLRYILIGVMHSVDKWFDEVDESVDEVNRAAQAREIALQAIEKRDAALEKAREALGYFAKSSCSYCGCGNGNHAYDCKVKEALAAIDKIGGREDV